MIHEKSRRESKRKIRPRKGGQLPQTVSEKGSPTEKGCRRPWGQGLVLSSFLSAVDWVPVNARPMMVTQQTVRNLAVGDKFFVRVAAVSSAGAGPPAVLERLVHIQETIGKAHPCSPVLPRHLS